MRQREAQHGGPYRAWVHEPREELRRLYRARLEEIEELVPVLWELHARRVARSVAAGVAIVCALLTFDSTFVADWPWFVDAPWYAASIMLPIPLLCYGAARRSARSLLKRLLSSLRVSGDADADLERMRRAPAPIEVADDELLRWERRSLWLPVMAIGVVVPVVLNFIVFVPLLVTPSDGLFSLWVVRSAQVASCVHLVLAPLLWRHVGKLCRGTAKPSEILDSYYVTLGLCVVPGCALPLAAVLVAVGGLANIAALVWAGRRLKNERRLWLRALRAPKRPPRRFRRTRTGRSCRASPSGRGGRA